MSEKIDRNRKWTYDPGMAFIAWGEILLVSPNGIEGTFGSWVKINPCIKVNLYLYKVSVF